MASDTDARSMAAVVTLRACQTSRHTGVATLARNHILVCTARVSSNGGPVSKAMNLAASTSFQRAETVCDGFMSPPRVRLLREGRDLLERLARERVGHLCKALSV